MVCLSTPYHFKFLKAVFLKFYLVHSWILRRIYLIIFSKEVPPQLASSGKYLQSPFHYEQFNKPTKSTKKHLVHGFITFIPYS